jgi:peptidoglycan/LPS O-acetylase OafA/YrhL
MNANISKDTKIHISGFDYLRVLSSFAVVIIHVSFTNELFSKWKLTEFAVPCFIMMSIFLLGLKKKQS